MTPEELLTLDPFTVVYRTFGTRSSRNEGGHRCFHLDPTCPALKDPRGKKGRLGAQLAAGHRLFTYEAGVKP